MLGVFPICSLGTSADYSGASFSANPTYQSITQQMSQAVLPFFMPASVTIGGWALNAASPVLDPSFTLAVQNMCGAYGMVRQLPFM